MLKNARKVSLPDFVEPCLATLEAKPPKGRGWVHEIKFDGYRVQAQLAEGRARLFTRNGYDWTPRFARIAAALRMLPVNKIVLDGEVVVFKDGLPNFGALQNAIDGTANQDIVYFLFDLPYFDGKDLRNVPLWARRALLSQLVENEGDCIRFSQDFAAPAGQYGVQMR